MVCKTLFDSQRPLAKSVVFTFGLLPICTGDNVLLRRFDQGPDSRPKKDMAYIWLHHLEHIPEVVKDPYVSSVKNDDPTKLISAKGKWRVPLLHLLRHAELVTNWCPSCFRTADWDCRLIYYTRVTTHRTALSPSRGLMPWNSVTVSPRAMSRPVELPRPVLLPRPMLLPRPDH